MRRTTVLPAAVAFCVLCSAVYAVWSVADKGTWPKSWPAELEPLRQQSRSLEGSQLNLICHEIPFAKREDFKSAWPHILKVKSKGAPVILVRGPKTGFFEVKPAGVIIHCPPKTDKPMREEPLRGKFDSRRERWLWTTFIELVIDGNIVDLNRIPLPPDTPIIDERFEEGQGKSPNRPSAGVGPQTPGVGAAAPASEAPATPG